MQVELADLIGELKLALVFVDVLQNLDLSRTPERVAPFPRKVAASPSGAPVFVLENYPRLSAFWIENGCQAQQYWWKAYRRMFRDAHRDFANLHYITGVDLMGIDRETSSDGVHANDLGFDRMFQRVVRSVRRTCPEFRSKVAAKEKRRRYRNRFE